MNGLPTEIPNHFRMDTFLQERNLIRRITLQLQLQYSQLLFRLPLCFMFNTDDSEQ